MRDLLQAGPREDRALAFLAAGCVLAFLAQWPGLARQAHLEEKALDILLGGRVVWLVLFGAVDVLHFGLAGEMGLGCFWAITVSLQCSCCSFLGVFGRRTPDVIAWAYFRVFRSNLD